MTTKITLIYDNPVDPTAFEAAYPDLIDRARKIPGVQRMETSKVWPKEDGTATPAYRMIDLYFPDYDAASSAVQTPEMGAFFPRALELATGGAKAVFADVEEA
ncbi:EthD family reductase [Promicromonospora sp. Marseille-Q5078]